MMFAGLRTGEVLALQWQDINFENKTINVERGLTIEPKFNSEGKVIKRITILIYLINIVLCLLMTMELLVFFQVLKKY